MSLITIEPSNARNRPTEKGLRYKRFKRALARRMRSQKKEDRELIEHENAELVKRLYGNKAERLDLRTISPGDVHTDSTLSTISKQYANDEYVGMRLMPDVRTTKRSNVYATYGKRDRFQAANDEVGPDGDVNQVIETRGTENFSVKDYALKNYVLLETLANQDAPLDEMVDLTEAVMDRLLLRKEKRIKDIVFSASSYDASNTAAVGAGASKWDDSSGGDIIDDILAAVSALFTGRNPTRIVAVCGRDVWNVIANNTAIKDLFLNVREGLAQPDRVAEYFGIDEILIADAREDTANIGASASFSRIWSEDNFAILRVAENPTPRSLHFGSTFLMDGHPVTNEWFDPSPGVQGAFWAKTGWSMDEKVVADDAGFLITDCLT